MTAVWEKGDVGKKALKLHRQFGHPTAAKLLKLITDSGIKNSELERAIKSVTEGCVVCLKHKKARPRPVVCMPIASKFNEAIAMDLKSWGKQYFLVIVDLATRYCTARIIEDKRSTTILRGLCLSWIVFFGAPGKILTDNGREFNNEDMRALGEAFNIKIMATSAESPWSNGVCERLNAVIGDIVRKIMADGGCGSEVALAWAVSARNALSNFTGFSPNQLVFGFNPCLPNIYDNDIPALEPTSASDIVRINLNALHLARQEYMKSEAGERLARALRHNIRPNDQIDVQNGDEVFYKRNDSPRWHGPGIVIGRDGKQILVRHGGVYVRVHECRLANIPHQGPLHVEPDGHEEVDTTPRQCLQDQELESESGDEMQVDGESSDREVSEIVTPSQPARLLVGQRIQGVHSESGELMTGRVVSRAGKATGKYRSCYNFKWDADGSTSWADINKDFSEWEIIGDDVEMMVMFTSEEILAAKNREIKSWQEHDVYERVEDVGQTAVSVRWVVTEKYKEGHPVVKARLVARGFEEDMCDLRKDSPTCSREAVRLTLALAATNGWVCHTLDVKAAYLQGNAIERVVHLRPPQEFADGSLWRLKKTVYGLCDAGRHWYLRVKSQMLGLGMVVSSLDPALFSWRCNGEVAGITCVHVDDFLWAGTHEFKKQVIDRLAQIFLIGSSESKAFKYVGLNVVSHQDGSTTLDQWHYASTLTPVKISKQRTYVKSSELSEAERSEYRALVGQLNWIATYTRPDIAFDVCELSVACRQATVADLLRLNKVISRVKSDNVKLFMPKMEKLENCYLECFSDASFANLVNSGSQGGFVVFLRDDTENRCPIFWRTRKIRRVVKSTLSAEAMALLEGAESSVYLARILSEISGCRPLKIRCFVDNKSLVDALYSSRSVDDKRLRIDLAVLRDMLEHGDIAEVTWVETSQQLADCLTKKGASAEQLRAAVNRN